MRGFAVDAKVVTMKLFSARVALLVLSFAISGGNGRRWPENNNYDLKRWHSEDRYDFGHSRTLEDLLKITSRRLLSSAEECARPCREGQRPKTCYYSFTVEYYSSLTRACNLCRQNSRTKVRADCQCTMADGYEKSGIITANRMYPGPGIMVCLNDNVVIDVVNRVPGNAITIHWHGVYQRNYPFFDGVPYVTQCPILEGTTFRYQWKAENSGTHFWHAHTGLHKGEGLLGPLIIREPKTTEVNSYLWDFDNTDNVIFLTDWFHTSSSDHFPGNLVRETGQVPDNFLINGMGQWTDPVSGTTNNATLATFTIRAGQRYRFRLINGCSLTCPVELTIEGHNLTIIASDGEPFEPFIVDSITTFSAERYDFIIDTNKIPGNYWIQLRGLGQCATRKLQQFAVLHYDSARAAPSRSTLSYDAGLDTGVVLNPLNAHCYGNVSNINIMCINNQRNANPVPSAILNEQPDIKLFLPFGFHNYAPESIFQPGTYHKYLVAGGDQSAGMIGNISNVFPTSPLLTQREDIPSSQVCSFDDFQSKCNGMVPCECVHIEKIPLNSVVELILVDEAQVAGLSHPFHLHGQPFYMFGEGDGDFHGIKHMNISFARDLDSQGQLNRHPTYVATETDDPAISDRSAAANAAGRRPAKLAAKDTFAVPNNGYSIIRFLANNPGYWLFHCHFEFHTLVGMAVIFQVGEPNDLPPTPIGFPTCGQYMPPLLFHD